MEARRGRGLIPEVTDTPPRGLNGYRSVLPDPSQPSPGTLVNWLPHGHSVDLGIWRGQPGSLVWLGVPSTHVILSFPPENGNRYEGYWQRGMKNGSGRFFHLDHGQLFEGLWVDDVAKCGTMIDFGRDEAPEPTQFPIPKVGSTHQGPVATPRETENSTPAATSSLARPSPDPPGNRQGFVFSQGIPAETGSIPQGREHLQSRQHPEDWQPGPSMLPNSTPASFQIQILDPDGVLEEALAMFKKTEAEED